MLVHLPVEFRDTDRVPHTRQLIESNDKRISELIETSLYQFFSEALKEYVFPRFLVRNRPAGRRVKFGKLQELGRKQERSSFSR